LPAFGETFLVDAGEFAGFVGVLVLVLCVEFVPGFFCLGALCCRFMVEVVDLRGNDKAAFGIEAATISLAKLRSDNSFLTFFASSGFNGLPCTPPVPASLLPNPIVVVNLMTEGLSFTALAALSAASIASRSWSPSLTCWVCHLALAGNTRGDTRMPRNVSARPR
jgi:hypothetical protein